MSNSFSRSQILKTTGAFIAGAAAARSIPLISDSPAQAQSSCVFSLCASSGGGFGSPQATLRQLNTSDYARLRFSAGTSPLWDIAIGGTSNVMNFYAGATSRNVMSLFSSGDVQVSARVFASGFVQSSSRELKENITELSSQEAFEALKGLRSVKFNYKANKEKSPEVGFIAEDVPELVAASDRKGVSSINIVGILTKVIQEQQNTILALGERVKALEAKNVAR